MNTVHLELDVGLDGVLVIRHPLGTEYAGMRVLITIEPVAASIQDAAMDDSNWQKVLNETYGACKGLGLERPNQGILEERETVE